MKHLGLQIVGGVLYLLNKVFLDLMERRRNHDEEAFWHWRRWAWIVYLVGLPPVVMILLLERDWILGAIEIGGLPAMLCGLVAAMSRKEAPKWLDRIALVAIPIGLTLSLLDHGGLASVTQLCEIGGSAGFLVGTYLLSKDRQSGYGWFMLMNVATGALLYLQNYVLFVPQQILSVVFIADAYRLRRARVGPALRGVQRVYVR